jgi:hypothetical protein
MHNHLKKIYHIAVKKVDFEPVNTIEAGEAAISKAPKSQKGECLCVVIVSGPSAKELVPKIQENENLPTILVYLGKAVEKVDEEHDWGSVKLVTAHGDILFAQVVQSLGNMLQVSALQVRDLRANTVNSEY